MTPNYRKEPPVPSTTDRQARAQRARQAGNTRAKAQPVAAAAKEPQRASQPATVVIHEDPAAQAARALASVQAAEAKRASKKAPSDSLPAQPRRAATRAPAKRTTSTATLTAPVLEGTHQQQLQAAIAVMTDEMMECRDLQHSYRKWAVRWLPKVREYERQLKCLRCNTIRVQHLSERGLLLGSSYLYAEGYLVKGLGRLDANDKGTLRLASIQNDVIQND